MKKTLIAASLALATATAHAINIEFDTRYDTGASILSQAQIDVLDYVANEFGTRLTDSLTATSYSSISFFNPGNNPLNDTVSLNNQTIAADTLRIFVGASELTGSTVGFGGSGGFSGFGDLSRGQTGAGFTDVAIWGGAITFNANTDWYVDDNPATLEGFSGSQIDFYSVVVHELAHVLGFGISGSWNRLATSTAFSGEASIAAYEAATGTPQTSVPLVGASHWVEGTKSFVDGVLQEASLDPTITTGTRKYMTDLDWAALSDLGWQVAPAAPVPEAHTWAMMLAGLGLLGWRQRRHA